VCCYGPSAALGITPHLSLHRCLHLIDLHLGYTGLPAERVHGFQAVKKTEGIRRLAHTWRAIPVLYREFPNLVRSILLALVVILALGSVWRIASSHRVLFPVAAPDIFNSMRLCLGIGWTYIVLAEVIKAGGFGQPVALTLKNGGTFAGAVCFFAGAWLMIPAWKTAVRAATPRTTWPRRRHSKRTPPHPTRRVFAPSLIPISRRLRSTISSPRPCRSSS